MHHEDGEEEAEEIGSECGVEIEIGIPLEAEVVSEQQGDEDAGDDDVAEPQHGEICGTHRPILEQILTIMKMMKMTRSMIILTWGKTSLMGASNDLATVTITSVPNTQKIS